MHLFTVDYFVAGEGNSRINVKGKRERERTCHQIIKHVQVLLPSLQFHWSCLLGISSLSNKSLNSSLLFTYCRLRSWFHSRHACTEEKKLKKKKKEEKNVLFLFTGRGDCVWCEHRIDWCTCSTWINLLHIYKSPHPVHVECRVNKKHRKLISCMCSIDTWSIIYLVTSENDLVNLEECKWVSLSSSWRRSRRRRRRRRRGRRRRSVRNTHSGEYFISLLHTHIKCILMPLVSWIIWSTTRRWDMKEYLQVDKSFFSPLVFSSGNLSPGCNNKFLLFSLVAR